MNSFYNLKRVKFIYHGDWCDPEVIYKRKSYNYYDFEECLYNCYENEMEETEEEKQVTFEKWISNNKSLCYELLNDLISYIKEY